MPTSMQNSRSNQSLRPTVQTGQLRWFCHVMRREDDGKDSPRSKSERERPRGRPRTSWLKYVDNILKKRGANLKVYTSTESPGEHFLLADRT